MPKNATFLLLTATALSLTGCPKKTAPAAPADAGSAPHASALAKAFYTGPLEPHVVARSLADKARLTELANGKLLLDTGIYVYELTPDGRVVRIGEPAAYAALLPDQDDQLGGYGVTEINTYSRRVHGSKGGALLLATPREGWAWNGGAWTRRADVPDGGEVDDDGRGLFDLRDVNESSDGLPSKPDIALPPAIRSEKFRRAADGTGILIGVASDDPVGYPVSFVFPPGSKAGHRVEIDDFGPGRQSRCLLVPSWSRPYLQCVPWESGSPSLYRLEGDRWERVTELPPSRSDAGPTARTYFSVASIGPDGSVWKMSGGDDRKVQRVRPNGDVDEFTVPTLELPEVATYGESFDYVQTTALDAGSTQTWDRMTIRVDKPGGVAHVTQILPHEDGSAWLVASEGYAKLVVHLSRPNGAHTSAVVQIGSETDQRNEVRVARGQKAWVAHCPLLFVPLAKQRADGSFSPEDVWARRQALAAVVKKSIRPKAIGAPDAALVEGSMSGRRVAGVLLWRPEFWSPEKLLEKAAHAVMEDAARAGPPPDVTCSAPVLTRAETL